MRVKWRGDLRAGGSAHTAFFFFVCVCFFYVQAAEKKQVIRSMFPKLCNRDFQWSLWSFLEVPGRNT